MGNVYPNTVRLFGANAPVGHSRTVRFFKANRLGSHRELSDASVSDTNADIGVCTPTQASGAEGVRILPWCKDETMLHTICKLIYTF